MVHNAPVLCFATEYQCLLVMQKVNAMQTKVLRPEKSVSINVIRNDEPQSRSPFENQPAGSVRDIHSIQYTSQHL